MIRGSLFLPVFAGGVCLFLGAIGLPTPVAAEDIKIDYPALIRAITAVESGGNPRAVGLAGERGLMQIKLATWREITKKEFGERIPFARAFEPELNQQVGQAYLQHIASLLEQNKEKINDMFLAVLVASYHCGPNCLEAVGFSTRRLSPQAREYVERVLNLHGIYSSESKVLVMEMETHPTADPVTLASAN